MAIASKFNIDAFVQLVGLKYWLVLAVKNDNNKLESRKQ